jgi:integrase
MPVQLSDRIVKQLDTPARGNRITYDDTVKGFGCRVTAAGARAFILNYRRKPDGRERRFTIGQYPTWSTAAAREEAKRLKRNIDAGSDPIGELEQGRAAPTVRDLAERFLADYVPRKRPATQRDYRRQVAVNIVPEIGDLKVAAVMFADIDRLHRAMSKRAPTQANRTVAALSRMFSLAVRWGMRADNPCRGIERNTEHPRKVYATPEELTAIAAALDTLEDQGAADAIRMMALTGARRGETLKAKWSSVNFETKTWTKPASTTKQDGIHIIPLAAPTLLLLKRMREVAPATQDYLFPPPRGKTEHRLDLDDAWAAVRKAANVPHLRLHDLRHTFASALVSANYGLPLIGQLLGHASPVTTARYAHLFLDPQRSAVEHAAAVITGSNPATAVPLRGVRERGA